MRQLLIICIHNLWFYLKLIYSFVVNIFKSNNLNIRPNHKQKRKYHFVAIKQKIDDKNQRNWILFRQMMPLLIWKNLLRLITITCALGDKRIKCIELIKDKRPEAIVMQSLYCAHCFNITNQCHNTTDYFHCQYCLKPAPLCVIHHWSQDIKLITLILTWPFIPNSFRDIRLYVPHRRSTYTTISI